MLITYHPDLGCDSDCIGWTKFLCCTTNQDRRTSLVMASRNVGCFLRLINCKPEEDWSDQPTACLKSWMHTQHFSSLWTSGFFYQLQACSQMIITLPSIETYIWNHPLHVFILFDYLEWNHSTWVLCILQFACVDTNFDRVLQFLADKVNWYNTDWNRYLQLVTLVIYEIGYGFDFKSRQNLFSKAGVYIYRPPSFSIWSPPKKMGITWSSF